MPKSLIKLLVLPFILKQCGHFLKKKDITLAEIISKSKQYTNTAYHEMSCELLRHLESRNDVGSRCSPPPPKIPQERIFQPDCKENIRFRLMW